MSTKYVSIYLSLETNKRKWLVPVENLIALKELFRNWLWLIQLDQRREERNDNEISYCRSIDRSFGCIEKKNIMPLLVLLLFLLTTPQFFTLYSYGSDSDRENAYMNDFFSLLLSSLLFSLFSTSKQVNAHTHSYKIHTHIHI